MVRQRQKTAIMPRNHPGVNKLIRAEVIFAFGFGNHHLVASGLQESLYGPYPPRWGLSPDELRADLIV